MVLGFARSFVRPPDPAAEPPPLLASTPLQPALGIRDPDRRVTTATAEPSGQYAAVTDAFGRVSLLQLEPFVLVRMWKGYRDAEVAFMQCEPPSAGPAAAAVAFGAAAAAAASGAGADVAALWGGGFLGQAGARWRTPEVALYLVIHAPRRQLLEARPALPSPPQPAAV
jgi:hypothetical protein